MTRIPLIPIDDDILTSYLRGGGTRLSGGRLPPVDAVLSVRQAGRTSFRLAPGAARALKRINDQVLSKGGAPIRITEAFRDPAVQAKARAQYELWLRAGKPSTASSTFDPNRMKAAFVARPGQSNHGWGGAIDIDVEALEFPGTGRGTDEALQTFWEVARNNGFEPIIGSPLIEQSESWHFDHLGGLKVVRKMLNAHKAENPRYRRVYSTVAEVGCYLAQTAPPSIPRLQERYVQARLLAGGFWCGLPDGYIGKKTVAALRESGLTEARPGTPVPILLAHLQEAKVGVELMESL